jgi:hypothetical protein
MKNSNHKIMGGFCKLENEPKSKLIIIEKKPTSFCNYCKLNPLSFHKYFYQKIIVNITKCLQNA